MIFIYFSDSLLDHVTLMQIDCSVVNTTLVKLKSESLPESLRKKFDDDKSAVLHTAESKRNNIKRSIEASLDTKLSDSLKNSSNNLPNYPANKKQLPSRDGDISKDDSFAQYLFSKYEESKQDTGTGSHKIKVSNETVQTKTINISSN